ncbi:hypothetical protein EDB83DRAFT_2325049 [Lactarius deliciosus]|nr:hypothetical protein EDB83DRAFT_2325049 [Lactarius deliciosus]
MSTSRLCKREQRKKFEVGFSVNTPKNILNRFIEWEGDGTLECIGTGLRERKWQGNNLRVKAVRKCGEVGNGNGNGGGGALNPAGLDGRKRSCTLPRNAKLQIRGYVARLLQSSCDRDAIPVHVTTWVGVQELACKASEQGIAQASAERELS